MQAGRIEDAGQVHRGRLEARGSRRCALGAPRAAARPAGAAHMYPYAPGGSEPLQVGRHGQQGAHDLAPVLGERHGRARGEHARDGAWLGLGLGLGLGMGLGLGLGLGLG